MVSICLHGIISLSPHASGRGRFGPTKTVIAKKYHPSVLKFCLTWTVYNISNKMTKFYDDVYSFEPVSGCQFLKLYISMFEKWLESPQWLLAVSKPKVRLCVTSAWGQELSCQLSGKVVEGLDCTASKTKAKLDPQANFPRWRPSDLHADAGREAHQKICQFLIAEICSIFLNKVC